MPPGHIWRIRQLFSPKTWETPIFKVLIKKRKHPNFTKKKTVAYPNQHTPMP